MMELAGKTGIITGGSSGLGFAAANVLAEAGAVVYAVSRSGRPKLEGETSHENVIHLAVSAKSILPSASSVTFSRRALRLIAL